MKLSTFKEKLVVKVESSTIYLIEIFKEFYTKKKLT
jgi:hypothetical protein